MICFSRACLANHVKSWLRRWSPWKALDGRYVSESEPNAVLVRRLLGPPRRLVWAYSLKDYSGLYCKSSMATRVPWCMVVSIFDIKTHGRVLAAQKATCMWRTSVLSRHVVVCQRPKKTCGTQVCYLQ